MKTLRLIRALDLEYEIFEAECYNDSTSGLYQKRIGEFFELQNNYKGEQSKNLKV